MGQLIIANQPFDIDANVVNWHQSGWDATTEACIAPQGPCGGGIIPYGLDAKNKSPRRYAFRPALRKYAKNPPLEAVKATIRQFVLHHDGCSSAAMCWEVLHNERGLSCHFIIDNDGTIFQTIDLAYMAYHAAEFNVNSIGVEFSNRGDAKKEPHYYEQRHQKRDVKPCRINNSTILAFDFTPAQYESISKLATALRRLLPNLPVEYPQSAPGQQAWETLPSPFSFSGYLGHYHLTARKWDPGPFDFKKFCDGLRGSLCFPMYPKQPDAPTKEPPVVPSNGSDLEDAINALYKSNEQKSDGGFFPVGPWGEYRLWHGGVHLVAKEKQPLFAPFPGRIVAARMGKNTPIGSVNFALVRHDLSIGQSTARFFSLYMHLTNEIAETDPKAVPDWITKLLAPPSKDETADKARAAQISALKKGEVALLDEPVKAGDILGRVGKAGPADLSRAQVHFEIFSTDKLFTDMDGVKFDFQDGSDGGRFCTLDSVNSLIDTNKDGKLDRRELVTFFAAGGGVQLKDLVVYNVSEWTADPEWGDALRGPTDFRDMKAADLDNMVAEQIAPGLWWTEDLATHAHLPVDGVVWHYHPIRFLRFVNIKIVEAAMTPPPVLDAASAGTVPDTVTDDFGDKAGASMVTDNDLNDVDPYDNLTPEQVIQGYDGDPLDAP